MLQRLISFIACWSLMIIVMLCSVNMTISSLDPTGDWIEMVAEGMEEEAEDSETEEESKKREHNQPSFNLSMLSELNSNGILSSTSGYQSVFREVFSPPPEV